MGAVVFAIEQDTIRLFARAFSGNAADRIDPAELQMALVQLQYVLLGALVSLGILLALAATFFEAGFWRHVADHTRLGTLQFGSDITFGRLFVLRLTNLLILIVTLGFGMPIVLHRSARFLSKRLQMRGVLDVNAVRQSDRRVPRFAEGMFQQLDAGAGLV